jgi:6-phosphogluconolactonase
MLRPLGVMTVCFGLLAAPAGAADVLFTQTNAGGENAVQVIAAGNDGNMHVVGTFPTGGSGLGQEIESDGMLAWGRRRLLVLNAGSNTISAFKVSGRKLVRTDYMNTGGERPVSVATAPNGRVLVANGATLTRFQVNRYGHLVRRGRRKLAEPNPYAVALNRTGTRAAVTYPGAPAARSVETFILRKNGFHSDGLFAVEGAHASPLAFSGKQTLLVGRMSATGAGLLHYRLGSGEQVSSFPTAGAGVCWLVYDPSHRRGWATFPSGLLSFAVADGIEVEKDETHVLAGETYDLAEAGDRVYVLNERDGATRLIAVDATTLEPLGESEPLAPETTGIVDLPSDIGGFSN